MVLLIYRQAEGGHSKQQTNKQTKQKAMCREKETGEGVRQESGRRRSKKEGGFGVGGGVRQEQADIVGISHRVWL